MDRAARPDRGGQDDGHRSDRRHRAERAAHGARQAQRARQGAVREDRAWRSATRWSRPSIAYVPEGGVNPPTGHMRFPGHDHRARRDVREGARIRGAQLQAPRLPRHRVARATTATTRRASRPSPTDSTASGRQRRCACTRSTSTTASPTTTYAQALEARGYSRRRDRHARGARRHVAHAGGRSAARARRPAAVRRAGQGRRRRERRSAPRERRRWGNSASTPSSRRRWPRSSGRGRAATERVATRASQHIRVIPSQSSGVSMKSPVAALRCTRPLLGAARASVLGAAQGPAAPAAATAAPRSSRCPACRRWPIAANLYSETRPARSARRSPATCRASTCRNLQSNDVYVIDPATFKVVDKFKVGVNPQHVVPSWDLRTLWVANNAEGTHRRQPDARSIRRPASPARRSRSTIPTTCISRRTASRRSSSPKR